MDQVLAHIDTVCAGVERNHARSVVEDFVRTWIWEHKAQVCGGASQWSRLELVFASRLRKCLAAYHGPGP